MSVSVLIVDDEELSRYALRTMFLKFIPDIGEVREADSGPTAVQSAMQKKVDIVVMDIRIPGMDGLEAARMILEKNPETTVFMISAHDNFEYARRALEIGAKGYILKPFRAEEVAPRIQAAAVEITRRNKAPDREAVLRQALENGLIHSYIAHNQSSVRVYKNAMGDCFSSAFFVLIEKNIQIEFEKLRGFLPSVFRDAFFRDGDIAVLLVPIRPGSPLSDDHTVVQAANELYKRLKKAGAHSLRLGIGPVGVDDDRISDSFTQAIESLSSIGPGEGVGQRIDGGATMDETRLDILVLEEAFLQEIRAGHLQGAQEVAVCGLERYFRDKQDLPGTIDFAVEFLLAIRNVFLKLGFASREINLRALFLELSASGTLQELVSRFQSHVGVLLSSFDAKPSGANDNRKIKIVNYINANLFNHTLGLDTAASAAGCSPQYFCRVFKDMYGQTFTGYVTEKRLEFAKHQLSAGSLPVSEIARNAGFPDINYFCRVFKKGTGFRPSEYRTYLLQEQRGSGSEK